MEPYARPGSYLPKYEVLDHLGISLEHVTDISSIYGVRCLRDPLITMYMFGLLGSNGPHGKDGARV